MNRTVLWYALSVLAVVLLLVVAAIPIAASDLFRQPYSPAWPVIDRTMARLRIDPFPTGGGAPPKFPYWRDPADAGIYFRNVSLETADGLQLDAWFVPVAGTWPITGTPSMVLGHGLLEDKATMLHLVPWLHDAGYNVFLLDFRGHGNSDKEPTTIGPKEVLDLQAALDWLEAEDVGERVGGLGLSLGAAALVNTAVQDDRLDALVLDSLFANWNDTDFAEDYRLPPDWLVPGVPSPEKLIRDIYVPILMIHGTADILENVDHAYRLYAAANEPKGLWINDSGHAWSSWTYPDVYREKILAFFGAALAEKQGTR